ncbi:MAG: AraC family transcriptional regulator, partial [Vallitaleaceae bacterium]|nr:AraC family transcriptional regulator [Vallitaleaceae bacterium]
SHKAHDFINDTQDIKNVVNIYLILICEVGRYLSDIQDDLLNVFRKDMNYYDRLLRFEQTKEMDIFIKNWVYWLMDYFSNQSNRTDSNVIEKAKKYIFNNYKNASFSFKELSQFLGFSEKYFSATFAKEVGETFTCYLTRIRIDQAKELMITTNMKIYEICEEIGYNNVEHFSRVFKKSTGFSPREYRKG